MKHIPRKRFGQHFLHDQHVIARIIAALHPQQENNLVEIGPGQGALTFPVLGKIGRLEVVELDRDLVLALQQHHASGLVVHSADALTFDFSTLKKAANKLHIFGNLPYNIATPFIFHLLDFAADIADMLFMVQKEVAQRLAAAPHSEHYGRLSVMVQYRCTVELLFDVSRGAFYPPPKVESSIVRLTPHATLPYPAKDEILFAAIVKQAFSQRRKTLRNSLREYISDADWTRMPVPANARAETLSVKDFVEMSNLLVVI